MAGHIALFQVLALRKYFRLSAFLLLLNIPRYVRFFIVQKADISHFSQKQKRRQDNSYRQTLGALLDAEKLFLLVQGLDTDEDVHFLRQQDPRNPDHRKLQVGQ